MLGLKIQRVPWCSTFGFAGCVPLFGSSRGHPALPPDAFDVQTAKTYGYNGWRPADHGKRKESFKIPPRSTSGECPVSMVQQAREPVAIERPGMIAAAAQAG